MIIDIFRYLSRSSVHSRIIIDIRNIFLVHHLFKLFPFREQIRWIRKIFIALLQRLERKLPRNDSCHTLSHRLQYTRTPSPKCTTYNRQCKEAGSMRTTQLPTHRRSFQMICHRMDSLAFRHQASDRQESTAGSPCSNESLLASFTELRL